MAEMGNLGKYELRREIGRGAMGVVFEAYDPMIKRIVEDMSRTLIVEDCAPRRSGREGNACQQVMRVEH